MSHSFPPKIDAGFPRTVAEASGFTSTSHHADVIAFIEAIQQIDPDIRVETFATTSEGRALPLVIAGPKGVVDPQTARASQLPVVFIMANIHAGEVEGKEAALMLLRDLAEKRTKKIREKLIVLIAPIYNADGNERMATDHRPTQIGPVHGYGIRENADGLDLNRDYMKLESPEARGLITNVIDRWDPLVTVDLHTTNGSYHGYSLTYAPCLNPNAPEALTRYSREKLLPDIREMMKKEHDHDTYYYGNFADQLAPEKGWHTYDSRPRFGNNYVGLRNRFVILSEAYSYIDYKMRIEVTYQFCHSILASVKDHGRKMMKLAEEADLAVASGGLKDLGVRFAIKPWKENVEILWERCVAAPDEKGIVDPETGQGSILRTGEIVPVKMTDFGVFESTERCGVPCAYLFDASLTAVVDNLRLHGIVVETLTRDTQLEVDEFTVTESVKSGTEFQGHFERTLSGKWKSRRHAFPAGTFLVRLDQRLARLAFYLLEPRSDDGLVNWNFLDAAIEVAPAQPLPLWKMMGESAVAATVVR